MQNLLYYINNPEDPQINFNLAREYESLGQTGSAISFYLRTAERSQETLLQYESLLRMSLCFQQQRTRDDSRKTLLQKAIMLDDTRPEAWFLLSQLLESRQEWQDSYNTANIGLKLSNLSQPPLITDVGYPGDYGLLFQKGVAAWWVGHREESRKIMHDLRFGNYNLLSNFLNAVNRNLEVCGWPDLSIRYDKKSAGHIRHEFPGLENLEKNHSQSFQDLFVLMATHGRRGGFYLEIGSSDPYYNNNTALLEQDFDWSGISIDIQPQMVDKFKSQRKNPVLLANALDIDYVELLQQYHAARDIDYLQVDCDPPTTSLEILKKIPFDRYRFAVITFEHDYYADSTVKLKSREFLSSHGYCLVAPDIAYDDVHSYEDWWVHPKLVSPEIVEKLTSWGQPQQNCRDYVFPANDHARAQDHPMGDIEIDWGIFANNHQTFAALKKEFQKGNYEKFFNVEEGDIVVDIGASVGPFTNNILKFNPDKVFCLEPHPELYKTLQKNFEYKSNVVCLQQGISSVDGETILTGLYNDDLDPCYIGDKLWSKQLLCSSITFKSLIDKYNLSTIDFLKIDCEGGEYDIFTDDNIQWIKNNVKKIVGEWHFHNTELKEKFCKFRDTYLKLFPNHQIFFVDHNSNFYDMKNTVWHDDFVAQYGWVNIYIDNRSQ